MNDRSVWLQLSLRVVARVRAPIDRARLKRSGFARSKLIGVGFVCFLAFLTIPVHAQSTVADTIFTGEFLTLDPSHPKAEAIAVSGGRILAIGSRSEVEAGATKNTRRIKIDGFALPGFADAHIHVAGVGEQLERLDLRGLTEAEILTKVAQAVRSSSSSGIRGAYTRFAGTSAASSDWAAGGVRAPSCS